MEIKLIIFDYLDRDPRVITFGSKYPKWFRRLSLRADGQGLWLPTAVSPPVTLSICHSTRIKALQRYSTFPRVDDLSDPYKSFYIDFKLDILALVENCRAMVPAEEHIELVPEDLAEAENFMPRYPELEETWRIAQMIRNCMLRYPNLKHIYPDSRWKLGDSAPKKYKQACYKARCTWARREWKRRGFSAINFHNV